MEYSEHGSADMEVGRTCLEGSRCEGGRPGEHWNWVCVELRAGLPVCSLQCVVEQRTQSVGLGAQSRYCRLQHGAVRFALLR